MDDHFKFLIFIGCVTVMLCLVTMEGRSLRQTTEIRLMSYDVRRLINSSVNHDHPYIYNNGRPIIGPTQE